MPKRFSCGNGLLRTAVFVSFLLAFFGSFIAAETVSSNGNKAAAPVVASAAATAFSCLFDLDVSADRELALEDLDPIETFRIDTEKGTLRLDHVAMRAKTASNTSGNTSLNNFPPLLE